VHGSGGSGSWCTPSGLSEENQQDGDHSATQGERVGRGYATTAPSASSGEGEGTGRPLDSTTDEQRTAQLLASRGEDIPIKESPTIEFVDPSAEDRAVLKPIYFDYDKSNIRPEFQPVLENISKWLVNSGGKQLLVEGHCDERGTDEYNLALASGGLLQCGAT